MLLLQLATAEDKVRAGNHHHQCERLLLRVMAKWQRGMGEIMMVIL
jgi:hypothetical protein